MVGLEAAAVDSRSVDAFASAGTHCKSKRAATGFAADVVLHVRKLMQPSAQKASRLAGV